MILASVVIKVCVRVSCDKYVKHEHCGWAEKFVFENLEMTPEV